MLEKKIFPILAKQKKNIAVFGAPRPTLNFCADPTTFFFQFDKEIFLKGQFLRYILQKTD